MCEVIEHTIVEYQKRGEIVIGPLVISTFQKMFIEMIMALRNISIVKIFSAKSIKAPKFRMYSHLQFEFPNRTWPLKPG
jgi:hypothetical protein